jgi:hypothetical protein
MPPEARAELVRAMADLLLEALRVQTEEGGRDESEDHV